METQCPHCKAKFNAPDEYIGKQAKCPKCKQAFIIKSEEKSFENALPTSNKLPESKPEMNDIRIFTTPILDGIRIKEYKGVVFVRNARAINIIRDFFTSFRDVFGGRSASYQKVMMAMQGEVVTKAKEEARKLGANAIIGFALDYDNIGSKSKSLLMASAKGTAVVI